MNGRSPSAPAYQRQWIVAILLFAGVLLGLNLLTQASREPQPPPLPSERSVEYVDWFIMVRCPELPVDDRDRQTALTSLRAWVGELHENGFHVRPFAEVMEIRARGGRLPARSVVFVFDPAYRVTVEAALPALRDLRTPALFVTESPGSIQSDRRFLSNHARSRFSSFAIWDFAVQKDDRHFLVEPQGWSDAVPARYRWADELGVTGVNRLDETGPLNVLHANARWSADDLIDRLKADIPLRKRQSLSMRVIEDRNWGVITDDNDASAFDLEADADARFASVTWAGSRGVSDLDLEVDIPRWFGEAWLFLRSNRERTQRIRIGFSHGTVRILQERDGVVLSDERHRVSIEPTEGIRADVHLAGDTLRLALPDHDVALTNVAHVVSGADQVVEFAVYHRVHGAAMAREVSIVANPRRSKASHDTDSTMESRQGVKTSSTIRDRQFEVARK